MNSRDRVRRALGHKEPDRVPIDLNGTIVTSLTRIAYDNLRSYLGLPKDDEPEVSHFAMDTVRAKEDISDLYGADTISLSVQAPDLPRDRTLSNGNYQDEYGLVWQKTAYYWDVVVHPFEGMSREEIDGAPWPDMADPGRYRTLREQALDYKENTEKCLVFDIPGLGPFEGACFLRNYSEFCADLIADVPYAEKILDKVTDSMIELWSKILSEVGDLVDVVAQGDDVGMQTGQWMGPDLYRKLIKPRKKRLFEAIKSKTDAKIFYHSCGAVYPLIKDFIDEGMDILNPIQRSAAGMDIRKIKQEFGKDVVLWGGGIDVQSTLPFLRPREILKDVKQTLDILMPGGGYVFFPSHNIQADVPPENIDAMFRAVLEYGTY